MNYMTWIVSIFVFIYILGVWLTPFPHWPTYFKLWKNVLFNHEEKAVHLKSRFKQIKFLLKYAFLCPFWGYLWYLDEILFPHYKQQCLKPVFIIGPPRSGSTFLHRTLAGDEETFFAVRHIEWRFPFITVQKLITLFGLETKISQMNYWPATDRGELASKLHKNNLYDWEEDGIFFEECFLYHFFIVLRFPYKNLLPYLEDFTVLPKKEQAHILQIHQKVVQKIMYLRGQNKLFLSKEPKSMAKMELMIKRYPFARFIITTRQSSDYLNSLLNLVSYSTNCKTGVDVSQLPWWESTMLTMQKQDCQLCMELLLRHLDNENQKSISYEPLFRYIVPTVKSIYKWLDCDLTPLELQRLEKIQQQQKKRIKGYNNQQKVFEGFESCDSLTREVEQKHLSYLNVE